MARTQLNGLQLSSVQKTVGFDALSPLTTKGDIVVFDGADNVRLPVDTSQSKVLSPNSLTSTGLSYKAISQVLNPELEWIFYDDFVANTTAGNNNLVTVVSGAAAAVALDNALNNTAHVGVISLATGTTATGRSAITNSATIRPIVLSEGESLFRTSLNIPTLSNATQRYNLRIGFGNNTAAGDFVDGVYLEYDDSLSANWRYKTSNNSVRSANNSTVAVATGWTRLSFLVNSTGTSVEFFVNGTSIGTQTANIPITVARATKLIFKIEKTVGTTSSIVYCDYLFANKVFSALR